MTKNSSSVNKKIKLKSPKIAKNDLYNVYTAVPLQKIDLPCPFEVLNVFGGKSKSNAPKAFKFGTKWVPIEVNNWWKFGVDISNHFWEIQNLRFFLFQVSPTMYENSFWKLFLYIVGDTLKRKNLRFWISHKWFEV